MRPSSLLGKAASCFFGWSRALASCRWKRCEARTRSRRDSPDGLIFSGSLSFLSWFLFLGFLLSFFPLLSFSLGFLLSPSLLSFSFFLPLFFFPGSLPFWFPGPLPVPFGYSPILPVPPHVDSVFFATRLVGALTSGTLKMCLLTFTKQCSQSSVEAVL